MWKYKNTENTFFYGEQGQIKQKILNDICFLTDLYYWWLNKAAHLQKNSVKTPANEFQIYCFVFNQSGWTILLCLNQVLKAIWTDYLVYTRNTPDLTCHAFNNQSHEPMYTQIYHVNYTESTLHCTVATIMWTV